MQTANSTTAILKFSDVISLWQYAQTLNCHKFEINTLHKTLRCTPSQQEIYNAVSLFGAKVDFNETAN
jgi:hypothetical protein